jgi:hypothetical protein
MPRKEQYNSIREAITQGSIISKKSFLDSRAEVKKIDYLASLLIQLQAVL